MKPTLNLQVWVQWAEMFLKMGNKLHFCHFWRHNQVFMIIGRGRGDQPQCLLHNTICFRKLKKFIALGKAIPILYFIAENQLE